MAERSRLAKVGFVLAIAGLAIAMLTLIPAVVGPQSLPWPLFVGSSVYLVGSFTLMVGSRGPHMKEQMGRLRLVRLGFIVVFATMIMRLVSN